MSVPTASVPGMANDIGSMAAAVTDFAEGHDMTVVPAIPGRDSGRTVSLDPDVVDLHGFLELARKLGDGALYLRTETFGLDPETGKPEEVPASLAHREGQVCELSAAFASAGHGLLHFWEQAEPWYQEFLDSQDAEMLDEGTDRNVGWDAAERARERAEELSDEAYRTIQGQLGDLAAEFLASPGWQQAASAGARKKAAEQFLTSRADGFFPPAFIRDELYAQTQRLFKSSGSGLF
jgi:hypothetical protein